MHPTQSPWLAQLSAREPHGLSRGSDADVVVVGAGIAGIATTYQLLMHSDHSVILVDAGRIAHGATGRNAGHVVNEFERPIGNIMEVFGKDMALDALKNVESGWDILEEMLSMSAIHDSYEACVSYNGFATIDTLLDNLRTHNIRSAAGIIHEPILVKNDPAILAQIPGELMAHVTPVPHSAVLEILHTDDTSFIGAEIAQIACMNSALFCEDLTAWMLRKFADRFQVTEETPVTTVVLHSSSAELHTATHRLTARHVVLCTNGYKTVRIEQSAGDAIDPVFHAMVQGVAGYMTGYLDAAPKPAQAFSYFHPEEYYITRRPYALENGSTASLTCLGGGDAELPENTAFDPLAPFPPEVEQGLAHEILHVYNGLPETATHTFLWQGLMGYTKNTIRRIGFEPRNNVLLYNLGCNGVGILPSVYGGKRIRQLLNGDTLPPSIFDPINGDR